MPPIPNGGLNAFGSECRIMAAKAMTYRKSSCKFDFSRPKSFDKKNLVENSWHIKAKRIRIFIQIAYAARFPSTKCRVFATPANISHLHPRRDSWSGNDSSTHFFQAIQLALVQNSRLYQLFVCKNRILMCKFHHEP